MAGQCSSDPATARAFAETSKSQPSGASILHSAAKDEFENGAVVSAHRLASQAGVDILKKGGNAVDAAVAVSYVLAVVHPEAGNIGGGGFMIIRSPSGEVAAIDYREKAPKKAHRDMYLDKEGNVITHLTRDGALAVGVPGTVAGTMYALEKYGTMSREEVLGPAIELAEKGWILDQPMGGEKFKPFASSDAVFNKPDGSRYEKGELWVQKDLAKTLQMIAERGRDGFYKGTVADLFIKTMEKYGGIITHEDLENYRCVERTPVTGAYRGYDIISMPPPSSGGICLIEMLNILERYDVGAFGWNTPEIVHLMVEAQRRTFADRAEYIADPDFIEVPVNVLTSKKYADIRAKDIVPSHATPSAQVTHGDIRGAGKRDNERLEVPCESYETTHYSVVGKDGMAVAVTTTLERSYGSYLVVEGAGFLLNNEMGDFSAKPGVPNSAGLVYGNANAIEPNKRMLSSMTPTIVAKDGNNFIVIGSPGGPKIITTVLQCIMNVVDHGMAIREAVAAGRFHHQWLPDRIEYEEGAFSQETIAKLKGFGHSLVSVKQIGDVQAVVVDPETGLLTAGPDPRKSGEAAGY
jgi:gamma-glutamyltranspeptidase/glutathione hydrolase